MPLLLDTSFLIAFHNERDVHHLKARTLWKTIEDLTHGQYFISDYIFDELMSVSLRKNGKEETLQLGNHVIHSIPLINIDATLFKETWKFFTTTNHNFSFTDCTNLIILKELGITTLATFDKEFTIIKDIELL